MLRYPSRLSPKTDVHALYHHQCDIGLKCFNGMLSISNDIIAQTTNQNKHMQQLWKVFDKIQEKGLKLNLKSVNLVKLLLITWLKLGSTLFLNLRRWILF